MNNASSLSREMTTRWRCEACSAFGAIKLPDDTGVYGGYLAVIGAHKANAPTCTADVARTIRVELVGA